MSRGFEIVAAGAAALVALNGCSPSEADRLREIEQSASTGFWVAPYAFHYKSSDGNILSAVRPFAEVDEKFQCNTVGEIGAASARLFVFEDGGRLVELKQPDTDDGLIRQSELIGRLTLHCLAFDDSDEYVAVPREEMTYMIPSIGRFPDGRKMVGQSTADLSDQVVDPIE